MFLRHGFSSFQACYLHLIIQDYCAIHILSKNRRSRRILSKPTPLVRLGGPVTRRIDTSTSRECTIIFLEIDSPIRSSSKVELHIVPHPSRFGQFRHVCNPFISLINEVIRVRRFIIPFLNCASFANDLVDFKVGDVSRCVGTAAFFCFGVIFASEECALNNILAGRIGFGEIRHTLRAATRRAGHFE